MYPPYTSLKVVHDQIIQEALERQRSDDGQTTHRQGLRQAFGKALTRFTTRAAWKQECPVPGSAQGETCTVA
jgi:hypothetical protein